MLNTQVHDHLQDLRVIFMFKYNLDMWIQHRRVCIVYYCVISNMLKHCKLVEKVNMKTGV